VRCARRWTTPRRHHVLYPRGHAAVTRTEPPVTSPPPRHENGPLAPLLTAPAAQSHTAREALEGERKQVTGLFADITDSLTPSPAFPGALPEAVAPGHPCGATLPHPQTPVQHQRKARCAWRRGAPAGQRRGPGRVGRAAGGWRWGAGGCAPGAGAKGGLKFLYVVHFLYVRSRTL
jgi:hypothetical protein